MGLGLALTPVALAEPGLDRPLPKVRSWTLPPRDFAAPVAPALPYRLRLELATVSGTRWTPEAVLEAINHAATILSQCSIAVTHAELHEFAGPQRYRHLFTPDSREFARRARLRKPAIFFVDDTRHRPAYDAEAIGRGNARTRPEMVDTVWITAATRDLPIALAHELVHVLTDSGDHSEMPGNLMREDTTPGDTHLTPMQCSRIVATGQANGLLEHGPTGDVHPPSQIPR